MPIGPGKYDMECETVQRATEAAGVILMVVGGRKGSGFSAALVPELIPQMTAMLRSIADQIEADSKKEFDDMTPMPFGEHCGKPLQDVPASYFHWLWNNGVKNEKSQLSDYIRKNIPAFKKENEDLIWH